MTVRSGLKCLESSMRQGPLGSLERMLAASSAWNSTRCLLTWKWKATPQGRSILELSASTPRTAGCASGLLPTSATRDYKGANGPEHLAKARGHHDQLPNAIAMLPTPTNQDSRIGPENIGGRQHRAERGSVAMADLVQFKPDGTSRGLKLQPAFVEWMMGYPLGFTHVESPDSKPSATPLSRKSHTKSSKQSRKSKGE